MADSSSAAERQAKLDRLVEIEGYDSLDDLLPVAVADSVCPAICMNDGCDYTTEMEPDQGIEIDRATLAFWVGYAAAEVKPLWRLMR